MPVAHRHGEPAEIAGVSGSDPVRAFAAELRTLRAAVGAPSYAQLARLTGLPRSTLHDGLRGQRLPSLELTCAVARACGGDEAAWRQRWTALRQTLADCAEPAAAAAALTPAAAAAPGRPRWRHRRLVTGLALGLAALSAIAATPVYRATVGEPCQPVRVYRIDRPGAVLDAAGRINGRTRAGDVAFVASLRHGRYAHRYYATLEDSSVVGYVDEAKLTYVHDECH